MIYPKVYNELMTNWTQSINEKPRHGILEKLARLTTRLDLFFVLPFHN